MQTISEIVCLFLNCHYSLSSMKKLFLSIITILLVIFALILWQTRPVPAQTLETSLPLPEHTQITRLVVHKSQRKMDAYSGDNLVKSYDISLGFNPIGHKQFEGDGKTPEGIYRINERNPNSAYHKNLGISYPNAQDKAYAQSQGKSAGGLIKIHGIRNGMGAIGRQHLRYDWTNGCIAVTNEEIDELYRSVVYNAEIDIRP